MEYIRIIAYRNMRDANAQVRILRIDREERALWSTMSAQCDLRQWYGGGAVRFDRDEHSLCI